LVSNRLQQIDHQFPEKSSLTTLVEYTSFISPMWLIMDWRFFQQTLARRLATVPFHIMDIRSKSCSL